MTPIAPPPDGADDLDPDTVPVDDTLAVDPASQLLHIEDDGDGGFALTFGQPEAAAPRDTAFDDNLADVIDPAHLSLIANDLIEAIELDQSSRQDWVEAYAEGIKLLGLTVEKPSDSAVEGMSTIRHPLLLEAVLRFQANARSELLPTDGPVKIRDDNQPVPSATPAAMGHNGGPPLDETTSDLADALETEANHYLTTVATEYYPDTDKMLFSLGLGGSAFKKVYRCPMRRRPVSESVAVQDLIVSNDATDLATAGRVTHRIKMRPAVMKRMQHLGAYRDIALVPSMEPERDAIDEAIEIVEGRADPGYTRDDDRERTLFECYAELDLSPYGIEEEGAPEGVPLPYVVTIDEDSRDILALKRNWREGDIDFVARQRFVEYVFVPGLKFLGIGLLHILGNTAYALTAAWRIALDGGMLSNFPGGLIDKAATRQQSMKLTAGPGQFLPVENPTGKLSDAVMPFPFKPTDPAFIEFAGSIASTGQRIGGTAEINVGEGRQDAPVGTTVAMIEQATKLLDSVHKRMHASQAREFKLIFELFEEQPADLYRGSRRSNVAWSDALVLQALQDNELVPVADPNTSSHMQRLQKSAALMQMAQQAPIYFNIPKLIDRVMRDMRYTGYQDLLATPQEVAAAQAAQAAQHGKGAGAPPQDTPADTITANAKMLQAQTDARALDINQQTAAQDAQVRAAEIQQKSTDNVRSLSDQAADRAAKEKLALLDLHKEMIVHASGQRHATEQAHADRAHDAQQAHADRGADMMKAGLGALVAHHRNEAQAEMAQQRTGLAGTGE